MMLKWTITIPVLEGAKDGKREGCQKQEKIPQHSLMVSCQFSKFNCLGRIKAANSQISETKAVLEENIQVIKNHTQPKTHQKRNWMRGKMLSIS